MSISAYHEVTEWDCEVAVPNHTYLFDGKSNILAYANNGGDKIQVFKKPLAMDTRYRKFVKVKHKALDAYAKTIVVPEEVITEPHFKVKSDSGKEYTVILKKSLLKPKWLVLRIFQATTAG